MTENPPLPIEVAEFKFKLYTRLKVFPDKCDILLDRPIKLVAAASKYGLLFVGTPNGIQCIRTADISPQDARTMNHNVTSYPRRNVQLISQPSQIDISCDNELLGVCVLSGGCAVLEVYVIQSFLSAEVKKYSEVRLSPAGGSCVLDLQWNPGVANMIAAVMSDGSAAVVEFNNGSFNINSIPPNAQASCLCWSPKGKQIVIGARNGSLIQYKPELKAVKTCDPPKLGPSTLSVVSVHWLSNFQFIAVYKDPTDPNAKSNVVVVNTPKNAPPKYIYYQDLFFESEISRAEHYFIHQQSWQVLVVCTTASMDANVLKMSGDNWTQWLQEEGSRPELPLTMDHKDVYNIGIALDTSNTRPTPIGEKLELGPMPILLMYAHNGVLCLYQMVNCLPDVSILCQPPQPVQDNSGLYLFSKTQEEGGRGDSGDRKEDVKAGDSGKGERISAVSPPLPAMQSSLSPPQGSQNVFPPLPTTAPQASPFANFSSQQPLSGFQSQSPFTQSPFAQSQPFSIGQPGAVQTNLLQASSKQPASGTAVASPIPFQITQQGLSGKPELASQPWKTNFPQQLQQQPQQLQQSQTQQKLQTQQPQQLQQPQTQQKPQTQQPQQLQQQPQQLQQQPQQLQQQPQQLLQQPQHLQPLPQLIQQPQQQPYQQLKPTPPALQQQKQFPLQQVEQQHQQQQQTQHALQQLHQLKQSQHSRHEGREAKVIYPSQMGGPASQPTQEASQVSEREGHVAEEAPRPAHLVPSSVTEPTSIQDEIATETEVEVDPTKERELLIQQTNELIAVFSAEMEEKQCTIKPLMFQTERNIKASDLKERLLSDLDVLMKFEGRLNEGKTPEAGIVSELGNNLMEMFGWYEKIRAKERMTKSSGYIELMESQDLDPVTKHYLKNIDKHVYYLESQIKQAKTKLGKLWENLEPSIEIPAMEAIYQSIVTHNNILAANKLIVESHETTLNKINKRRLYRSSRKKVGDLELSTLADRLLDTTLGQSDSVIDTSLKDISNNYIALANKNAKKPLNEDKLNAFYDWQKSHKLISTKVSKSSPVPITFSKDHTFSDVISPSKQSTPYIKRATENKPISSLPKNLFSEPVSNGNKNNPIDNSLQNNLLNVSKDNETNKIKGIDMQEPNVLLNIFPSGRIPTPASFKSMGETGPVSGNSEPPSASQGLASGSRPSTFTSLKACVNSTTPHLLGKSVIAEDNDITKVTDGSTSELNLTSTIHTIVLPTLPGSKSSHTSDSQPSSVSTPVSNQSVSHDSLSSNISTTPSFPHPTNASTFQETFPKYSTIHPLKFSSDVTFSSSVKSTLPLTSTSSLSASPFSSPQQNIANALMKTSGVNLPAGTTLTANSNPNVATSSSSSTSTSSVATGNSTSKAEMPLTKISSFSSTNFGSLQDSTPSFNSGPLSKTVSTSSPINTTSSSTPPSFSFGSAAQTSNTTTAPIFGSMVGTTTSSSIFENITKTTTSIFGGTTSTTPSTVDNSNGAQTSTTSSIFSSTDAITLSSSIFDSAVGASPPTTTSIFGNLGKTTLSSAPSIFGATTLTTSSTIGSGTLTTTTSSIFEGAAGVITTTPSIFGSSMKTTPSSVPATASFFATAAGVTVTTAQSLFGGSTGITVTTAPSLFGPSSVVTAPLLFGSSKGTPITTTTSIFGGAGSAGALTPSTIASTTASVLTSPSTTTSASSASIFRGTAISSTVTTATPPASTTAVTSTPIFSGVTAPEYEKPNTTPQVFDNFKSTSTTSQSFFSSTPSIGAVTTSSTSIFGNPSKTSSFGPSSTTSFGTASTVSFTTPSTTSFATPSTTSSFFGNSSVFVTTTTTSSFGPSSDSSSIFGTANALSSTPFFNTTTTTSSSFANQTAGSIFGGEPSFGTPTTTSSTSFFGKPICSPTPTTNVFGTSSVFGQSPTTAPSSIFGGGTSYQSKPPFENLFSQTTSPGGNFGTSGSSIFGGAASFSNTVNQQSNIFQSGSGSGGMFGSTASPGGFSASPQAGQGMFGAPPSFQSPQRPFGGTGTGSVFGSSPSFPASSPAFTPPAQGTTPPFGSPNQQASSTFENLASQDTPSFGNLAQQQTFQNTSFAGSSFSAWR